MSNKRKLVESERTPAMVMNAWKARELLKKELKMLDSHKELVVGRITLNQRITYKRFKHQLNRSKISHAKIMGDKETLKELKTKQKENEFNTNFGLDPVDEEVLERIWSSSRKKPQASDTMSVHSEQSGTFVTRLPSNKQRAQSAAPIRTVPSNNVERPKTSPGGGGEGGRYITTGAKQVQWESEEEEEKEARKGHLTRPKFKSSRPISAPPPQTTNIFNDDNDGPTLLDIHKERIRCAGYEDRVRGLCGKMQAFSMGDELVIPDYYKYCRDAESEVSRLERNHKAYKESKKEELKSIGNPHVRSLTFKPLMVDGVPYTNDRLYQTLPDYRPSQIDVT